MPDRKLIADLDDVFNPLLLVFRQRLRVTLLNHAVTAYIRASAQVNEYGRTITTDRPIYFEGPPMRQAIAWADKHAASRVTLIDQETRERLASIVAEAIENKKGIDGLARAIRADFKKMGADMPSSRARLIARTETAEALGKASESRSKAIGANGKQIAVTDPCDICTANAAEGKEGIVPIDHVYQSGQTWHPFHPNCLLPNIRVEAAHIIAGNRAFYRGKAIEILTENGHLLTVTPDHMILTPSGFIAAKFLRERDYVICSTDSKRMMASMNPNNNYSPAPIAEIWDALVMQNGMLFRSMPVTSQDFYSDVRGFEGNINIIYPNCFLLGNFQSPIAQHFYKDIFNGRDTSSFSFPGFRPEFSFGNCLITAPRSDMRSHSAGLSLLERQVPHSNNIGLSTIAGGDTSFEQSSANNRPAYTELSRQFQFRFATLIAPEQIIKVRYFYYSGHVFDLQTLEQLYIASSIVVHNCRCCVVAVMLPGEGEKVSEGGPGSGPRPRGGGVAAARAERARASYNPATAAKQRIGEANETKLATAIGGKSQGDNKAFDVVKGDKAIEVKTIVGGKNDKITMHPRSLARKQAEAAKLGLKPHTVVFDARSGAIYHREGLGSYRLSNMTQVASLQVLGRIL